MTRARFDVWLDLGGETVPVAAVDVDQERGRLRAQFDYRDDYLARPVKLAVDPATPVSVSRRTAGELPRGIADAGPDGWGRRLLLRAHRGRDLTEADFLLGVADATRLGAFRFTASGGAEFLAADHDVPPSLGLAELSAAAERVESDPDDLTAVGRLLATGTGALGGVRPKASMIGEDGRQRIVKFASTSDQIEVVGWEGLCLDLASIAGIPVPASRLVPIGTGRALVLDRFDRDDRGNRVPYLSAYALSEAPDPVSGDYVDISDLLPELDVADLAREREQLWRRAVFNVAMRNTDDHLKNHGMLWSATGWRWSPAFDITPNPIGGAPRATAIDGEVYPAGEARALRRLGHAVKLTDRRQASIVGEVLAAVTAWETRARDLSLSERDIDSLRTGLTEAQARLSAEFA